MNTLQRAALAVLLLFSFTVAASLDAQATTETFTFQMKWTDFSNTYTTSGSFTLDNTTFQLVDYNITVQDPFGTVTPNNSVGSFFVNGGPCRDNNPCFGLFVMAPGTNGWSQPNRLWLAFAGDVSMLNGGQIVPLTSAQAAIANAFCDDPCSFTLVPDQPPPPVPEPSSMLLMTTGALGLAFRLRHKIMR